MPDNRFRFLFKPLLGLSSALTFLQVTRRVEKFFVRVYALILLFVVAWAGYTGVAYLFRSVFVGGAAPQEYVRWQGRGPQNGAPSAPAPTDSRPPLAHYHTIGQTIQPDPHNGCTACHNPMPHNRSEALRSFSNFHATFLACQTCHDRAETRPIPARWISITTGEIQPPPALLQLMSRLETDAGQITDDPAAIHPDIVRLLKTTLDVIGEDPLLRYLLIHIDTAEPGSPAWRRAVDQLSAELPQHLRGQYGAKIAPTGVAEDYRNLDRQFRRDARRYGSPNTTSDERAKLHETIHASLAKEPAMCLDCHAGKSSLLDFAALGYSPIHARLLNESPIARQMQQIQEGRPFYLPKILEGNHEH